MDLHPYLFFPGTCAEAMDFYAEVFGGEVEAISTFGDGPVGDEAPEEMKALVMHARLRIGDRRVLASDSPPGRYERPQGFCVSVSIPDLERAKRVFQRLAKMGEVTMPFEATFWAKGFGMCRDRYGTPWMISTDG